MSDSVRPQRWQPIRLPRPWDSPGKNTGVGCHFLLQCMKVKSESELTQSCPTPSDPMDCSIPGSSVHGIFQARVLEWGTIAFSVCQSTCLKYLLIQHIKKQTWKQKTNSVTLCTQSPTLTPTLHKIFVQSLLSKGVQHPACFDNQRQQIPPSPSHLLSNLITNFSFLRSFRCTHFSVFFTFNSFALI